MKKFYYFLCFSFLCFSGNAQTVKKKPDFLKYQKSAWVDSVMKTLSPDERIAQLIMVAAYSNRGEEHKQEILKLINEQKIGGLIFFQGDPENQVELMNEYQQVSEVPLLGAIDAEWGLGMRLDSTISFPFQMTLGAIQNNELLREMGGEIGRQVKQVGLHMNFAPVVDVNNNPNNPVINFRSFGEDKFNVAEKAIAYMQGMQKEKILTTAKHFPGHGDTDADSHYVLPQINHPIERLDSLELYPFRRILKAGIGGVMVAHLDIPALDSTGLPSTLSKPIITGLLKEKLKFEGLIVTDAMNMKGVTKGNEPGIVDKDAILAGNDLLEFTEDVPKAIAEIRNAIKEGLISQKEIDRRVRKILAVKQWVGLHRYRPVSTENILQKLNTPEAELLNRKLFEASLTVLKNEGNVLPVEKLENKRIASISFGKEQKTVFQKTLDLYTGMTHFYIPSDASEEMIDTLRNQLGNYDLLISGIHDESKYPRNSLRFSQSAIQLIAELSEEENSILVFFKNPYVLNKIENIEKARGLIITYQDNEIAQELAAQLIFGGIGANGKLPVSIGDKFPVGTGEKLQGKIRLGYSLPEAVGVKSDVLEKGIDSLLWQAIDMKAIPGGQILVAKDQKVIFYKAYGEHVYHDTIQVGKEDLYDIASVTKIASVMPALMKLYDEDQFDLDQTLADHLPKFRRSNKSDIEYREILAHQGRLQPWIPFWKNTLRKNNSYRWWTIKKDSSARYPIKITEEMYLHRNYPKRIRKAIRKSSLLEEKKYAYSDFFFILAPEVIESISGKDFEKYLRKNFYDPLGASTLTFRPSQYFSAYDIVPTEDDFFFRHKSIHGSVHDETAIMLGGVSGHAGLFSNANDLAKLMQMFLNGGKYGGKRYISEATIKEFTRVQFPENNNRRALGFDKPYLKYEGTSSNTAKDASADSFGHTGFTGTMVWMDPEYNLLYIFLSNRVAPSRENKRLYSLNTRTQVQQVIYDSLSESEE